MRDSAPRRRARGTCLISLIGNLGGDPEMRFTQAGVPLTTFSVAVNNSRRGPDGGDIESTDWFRCTCWRELAEVANNYLQRGSQVFVHGRFRTSTWQGRDGETRTSLEIDVRELRNLSRGREEPGGAPPDSRQSGGEVDPDDLPF